jgi:hypothetical protein
LLNATTIRQISCIGAAVAIRRGQAANFSPRGQKIKTFTGNSQAVDSSIFVKELDMTESAATAGHQTMVKAPDGDVPALAPSSLGELVPLSRFTGQELAEVKALAKGVDWSDANSIMAQMNAPNQRFADAITRQLSGVAVYETGEAAGLILELSRQIKGANLQKMRREVAGQDWVAANFGHLPLVGSYVSAIRHFQLTHKSLVDELNRIRDRAQKEVTRLRAVHQQLEDQEIATERVLREMMTHIAACQLAVGEARDHFVAQREALLAGDRDPFKLQKLRDLGENISLMETRLINAKVSFIEKMLAIPDIRARQTAARIEISNTIDTIQNDIPDLASAIGRLVASYHIAEARKSTELRREMRKQLGEANADALDSVYLNAKRSQAGANAEIDDLSARVERLMKTLEAGTRIDEANAASRAESNRKLVEIRDAVIDGLSEAARRALKAQ